MKPASMSACVLAPKTGSSSIDAHRTPSQRHEDIYSEATKLHTWVDRYNLLLIACHLFSLRFDSFKVCINFVAVNNVQINTSVVKRLQKYYNKLDNIIKTIIFIKNYNSFQWSNKKIENSNENFIRRYNVSKRV